MKAILEYSDDKEDVMALRRSLKALDMAIALFEIQHNLRKNCERELEALEADSDKWDGMEIVLRQLNTLMEENGIHIEELIE